MKNEENNVAYIDGANLHKGISTLSWEFSYERFRIWLKDKYGVKNAYLFLGYIPKYKDRYAVLQEQGYILVFKDVIFDGNGKAKGNCDADIVVHSMQGAYENKFEKMVLVSSDGDYAPLVKFLKGKDKMGFVISPYETKKCSVLLKRTGVKISYISDQENILKEIIVK